MKKLLLILLTTILFSCGYAPMDNSNYIIITCIEKYDEIYSKYYGMGNSGMIITLTENKFVFKDTTGKFQINDTINFVKK